MKKLLSIIVLGLLWCNTLYAFELRNYTLSLRCYSAGWWLYSLDISNDKNVHGYVSETNSWDGEKTPEITLVITANEIDERYHWEGEVIFVNRSGKKLFTLTQIESWGADDRIQEIHAAILSSTGDTESLHLSADKTFNFETGKTNEEIYYVLKHIDTRKISSLKKRNKKIDMMNESNYFRSYSSEYACFK